MAKIRFKVARMGFPAGHVCDESLLREGIVKTLKAFDVLETLDEQPKLDSKKNDKPKRASGKSGRGKGTSPSKRKQPE